MSYATLGFGYIESNIGSFEGVLPVISGGTGNTSLTGVLIGNGTAPLTTRPAPAGDFVGTLGAQTLRNKTLVDVGTSFVNPDDPTIAIHLYNPFANGYNSGSVLNIQSNQTSEATINFPDIVGSDDLVCLNTPNNFTNTNNWSGESNFNGSTTIKDDNFQIVATSAPNTKIKFDSSSALGGTTLTFRSNQAALTGAVNIPSINGSDTVMLVGASQTITGSKLHTGTLTVNDNSFIIRDQLGTSKQMKFEVSAGSNNCTLTIAGRQTSSRQIYIPNLTINDDYFVTENTTQTMVNKTITSPIIDGTTNMPTLTASQAVVTDASKNLVSLPYTQLSTASSIPYRDADGETYFNSVNLLQRSITSSTSTTTLNDHDPQLIMVTGTQPHTIRLPAATSYLQVGRIFIITNRGTKDIRVEANTGAALRSAVASATSISAVCNSIGFDGSAAWTVFNDTQYAGRLQTSNGSAVEVQNASPPSTGQVLTALTSTTASWQTPDPGYTLDNVQTTNATPTTFGATALSTGSVLNIKAYVVARNTNASTCLGYELFAVANNNAGTVTIIGGVTAANVKVTNGSANATLIVSGTSVVVQVTGLAGQTIDWRCKIYTVAV